MFKQPQAKKREMAKREAWGCIGLYKYNLKSIVQKK